MKKLIKWLKDSLTYDHPKYLEYTDELTTLQYKVKFIKCIPFFNKCKFYLALENIPSKDWIDVTTRMYLKSHFTGKMELMFYSINPKKAITIEKIVIAYRNKIIFEGKFDRTIYSLPGDTINLDYTLNYNLNMDIDIPLRFQLPTENVDYDND